MQSEAEIKRWEKYMRKYETGEWKGGIAKFEKRLKTYKASLVLGRGFLEPTEQFLKRKGLKKFWEWHP